MTPPLPAVRVSSARDAEHLAELSLTQRRGPRRPLVAVAVVLVVAVAAVFAVRAVTSSSAAAPAGAQYPTALVTIDARSLSSQVQVAGSVGYAGSYSVYNQAGGTVTALPHPGQVISNGQALYDVDGSPVVLLTGSTPAYRDLQPGVSGADVAQLNADLVALGDATNGSLDPASTDYSAATTVAVKRLQASLGVAQTGVLARGQVVFLPTSVRVVSIPGATGESALPGGLVMQGASTARQVVVQLDASRQLEVAVGDQVTISLPQGGTTQGTISAIALVATQPSSSGSANGPGAGSGSSNNPTVEVDIRPTNPDSLGTLDDIPVQVAITTQTVDHALVIPVDALLATSDGGYDVEVVPAGGGTHRLVPVTLGLFDDADGLVQVTGSGIAAGEQVVVPQL